MKDCQCQAEIIWRFNCQIQCSLLACATGAFVLRKGLKLVLICMNLIRISEIVSYIIKQAFLSLN